LRNKDLYVKYYGIRTCGLGERDAFLFWAGEGSCLPSASGLSRSGGVDSYSQIANRFSVSYLDGRTGARRNGLRIIVRLPEWGALGLAKRKREWLSHPPQPGGAILIGVGTALSACNLGGAS
jgi:hypothetical protein